MTESLSGSFYYGMEELALDGYDSRVNVDPSEYLRFDEDITYQDSLNTLGQNVMAEYSTESYPIPTTITSEIMGLREDINLLKQTIENQKDLFHEELGQYNEEIRILKKKLEEENDTESDSVAITPSRTTTRRDISEERLAERQAKWRISCIYLFFHTGN